MKTILIAVAALVAGLLGGLLIGSRWPDNLPWSAWVAVLPSPWTDSVAETPEAPLQKYSFPALRNHTFEPAQLSIAAPIVANSNEYSAHRISIATLGKTMSGQLNLPSSVSSNTPVIVMIRGYVPAEIYQTGVGTRNAAAQLAQAGFITIAPDFFGYGLSDPEPEDSWQARFEKPIIVGEIIEGIRQNGIPLSDGTLHTTNQLGIWGHSNGGQIALSVLETMQEPLPTTLWAPVTAPFPYSILYFSDEHEDEGRAMRIWVHQLESIYNLSEFSITQYVDGLRGPLMIHHGTGDDAALASWTRNFSQLIDAENSLRSEQLRAAATNSAQLTSIQLIDFTYHEYPGADHNLQPVWNTVVERDIAFFRKHFQVPGDE